jgi:tight adherence protein C
MPELGLEMILPALALLAVVFFVFFLLSLVSNRNTRAEDRLARLNRPVSLMDIEPPSSGGLDNRMKDIIERFSGLAKPMQPKTELEQSELRLRLQHAGFRSDKAMGIYLGIKFATILLSLIVVVAVIVPIYWDSKVGVFSLFTGLGGIILALTLGIGFWGPDLVLFLITKSRKEQIFLTLPDVLDLMVVCVESGLGLDQALRKVCEEMKEAAPIICEEIGIANFQLQMGRPKRDVLHDLGARTGVDDMKSLVAILIQADRFGTSVAQALRVQSDAMRTRRKQLAEERAAKCAVKLIFPLVIFIFPAIFVVLGGPAYIQLKKSAAFGGTG